MQTIVMLSFLLIETDILMFISVVMITGVMLSVIMQSAIMMSVIMLSVIMLSVTIVNVVAPTKCRVNMLLKIMTTRC
jgi:hypothetical protein